MMVHVVVPPAGPVLFLRFGAVFEDVHVVIPVGVGQAVLGNEHRLAIAFVVELRRPVEAIRRDGPTDCSVPRHRDLKRRRHGQGFRWKERGCKS